MRLIKYLTILFFICAQTPSWADDTTAKPAPTRTELALFAMGLVGAIYKPGGDNPSTGMDCSGFVKYVFGEVIGLKLPHNALAMSKISNEINKADLKPGDLVFFKTTKVAFSHVGIYLGDNRFIHAASSRTGVVMISHLDDAYWRDNFNGARRLANPVTALTGTANASSNLPSLSE
ncbi:MAG: C40 family peptidase [Sulfuriferula sp.]|nr:C40 family peptidase [Sulfuriferula sp.]